MTRAALLPAGADPFLNAYWLRNYRTWADSVDELQVAVCGDLPAEVLDYTRALIEIAPHATMHHFPQRMVHGQVLTFLLRQTSADHVVLLEDDAFIRKPAVMEEAFRSVESGTGVVACPRNAYASDHIVAAAEKRFGEEPRGLGFWPCFLFIAREHLAATDRVFDGIVWPAGAKLLGTILTLPGGADTFIWASYQLRDMGLSVELRDMHRLGEIIRDDAPWFHVGSLSSGHGWGWQNGWTPERYQEELGNWSGTPVNEIAKRMAWWQRAWDNWDGQIPAYHAEYEAGFRGFMADFGIGQDHVDELRRSYDWLVTWAERPTVVR